MQISYKGIRSSDTFAGVEKKPDILLSANEEWLLDRPKLEQAIKVTFFL